MKLKLKFVDQQKVVEVNEETNLIELCDVINESYNGEKLGEIGLKTGFPPKVLVIEGNELQRIVDLGIKNGEVIIVDYQKKADPKPNTTVPINLEELPYIELAPGFLSIYKIPDDNSCLFHSIIHSAGVESYISTTDLRNVVASTIRENLLGIYNSLILGKGIEEYCDWITHVQLWGGEIEIDIIAKFLDIQVITVDIESGHEYKFNESLANYILLAYSGIHYDSIVYQEDFQQQAKFSLYEDANLKILENLPRLSSLMKEMGWFTNTGKFKLKCGDCGKLLVGERDASQHASEYGHMNFQEYK